MADIWEYIAKFNPQGFYEENKAQSLSNDLRSAQVNAANRENALQNKIMGLKDALANGDKSALKALGVYTPETTRQYMENTDEMLKIMRPFAESVLKTSPENREKAYQQMIQYAKNNNIDVSDVPANYDELFVTTLANSDPQKIRDERINEMQKERDTIAFGRDLEKMRVAHDYSEESAENAHNRDIAKMQYAYDRADKKTQEAVDWLTEAFNFGDNGGRISEDAYMKAMGKLLGVDVNTKSDLQNKQDQAAEQGFDYLLGNLTPEQEQNFISRQQALAQAKSTKSGETPAQQMERLRKAGFTSESVQQAVMNGDASLLVPDTAPKGSISANAQGNANYEQWLDKNPNATDDEKRNARAQFGIMNFDDQMGLNIGKIEAQGQNAINLENVKQGNRLTMADVNEQNAERLENIKQQNRVGLAWIKDQISEGKELRDLNNAKSLAEFKNSLPTEKMIELANTANYLKQNGFDVTAEQLLAREYENALKAAELDRQYKQAQIEKTNADSENILAGLPYVGKTDKIKNVEYMVENGIAKNTKQAFNMLEDKTYLGEKGDVVNGVTLTGNKKYDEEALKTKAKQDMENLQNKKFVKEQKQKLLPLLKEAYKAAKDGRGIGFWAGNSAKFGYVQGGKKGADNVAVIRTLQNAVGPTMIAQLKAAGAGARSFDSEGERLNYLPQFKETLAPELLAETILQFADKMLGISKKELGV